MVTEVKFLSGNAQIPDLTFPVMAVGPTTPMHVRNITGVDPVTAEIITKANADDGDFFIDSRIGKRNIVITLGLNPGAGYDAVETARRLLYAYMLPKGVVKLQFASTNRGLVTIEGYVESLAAPLFSQDPEAQISIICPKSNFYAKDPTFVYGVAGADPNPVEFDNPGDMTSRVELEVHKGAVTYDYSAGLTIETRDTRPLYRPFSMDTTRYVYTNGAPTEYETSITDERFFYLSSYQGRKLVESRYETFFALLYDTTTYISLLRWADLSGLWPYLSPGVNRFRVLSNGYNYATSTERPAPDFPWTLKYYPQYGGL